MKYGIECTHCSDRLFSMYRHDSVRCKCGKVFVDGGDVYFRMGFEKPEDYKQIEMTEEDFNNQKDRLSHRDFKESFTFDVYIKALERKAEIKAGLDKKEINNLKKGEYCEKCQAYRCTCN